MPVGTQIGSDQLNNIITALAVNLRDTCRRIYNLNRNVNGQGTGLAYLQSIGYSNTSNPANPGSVSDAALALSVISYLNTVSAVYFGAAPQTPAFDFDQQLSEVWGGQVTG